MTPSVPTAIPKHRPDLIACEVVGEGVVYDPAASMGYSLNTSAAAIWELCDGLRSVLDICRALGEELGVPGEDLLPDVSAAVAEMERHGLIALHHTNAES